MLDTITFDVWNTLLVYGARAAGMRPILFNKYSENGSSYTPLNITTRTAAMMCLTLP